MVGGARGKNYPVNIFITVLAVTCAHVNVYIAWSTNHTHGHVKPALFFRLYFYDAIDVIQEMASRGLGLVYDLCDDTTRNKLVQLLLETLMEGKK